MMKSNKKSSTLNADKKVLLKRANQRFLDMAQTDTRYKIRINKKSYVWSTNNEKISLIRKGLPYAAIETISFRTNIPVKHYLNSLEIVQTTYNKRKKNNAVLSKQDSEFIVELIELYDFGLLVFNSESEKFQRWLRKPNISLGSVSPDSFFDSLTGIREVKKALNRIEFGNMA